MKFSIEMDESDVRAVLAEVSGLSPDAVIFTIIPAMDDGPGRSSPATFKCTISSDKPVGRPTPGGGQ